MQESILKLRTFPVAKTSRVVPANDEEVPVFDEENDTVSSRDLGLMIAEEPAENGKKQDQSRRRMSLTPQTSQEHRRTSLLRKTINRTSIFLNEKVRRTSIVRTSSEPTFKDIRTDREPAHPADNDAKFTFQPRRMSPVSTASTRRRFPGVMQPSEGVTYTGKGREPGVLDRHIRRTVTYDEQGHPGSNMKIDVVFDESDKEVSQGLRFEASLIKSATFTSRRNMSVSVADMAVGYMAESPMAQTVEEGEPWAQDEEMKRPRGSRDEEPRTLDAMFSRLPRGSLDQNSRQLRGGSRRSSMLSCESSLLGIPRVTPTSSGSSDESRWKSVLAQRASADIYRNAGMEKSCLTPASSGTSIGVGLDWHTEVTIDIDNAM